jgi:hypothetical protein
VCLERRPIFPNHTESDHVKRCTEMSARHYGLKSDDSCVKDRAFQLALRNESQHPFCIKNWL